VQTQRASSSDPSLLQFIQLSAQRLRKRYGAQLAGEDGAVFDECTRTIVGQVEELKRLVNEFSMFARLPAVQLAPHDLNAIIEEALVLFRQAHPQISFEFRSEGELPPVDLDREAIKRALINGVQPIHIPAYMVEMMSKLNQSMRELEDQLGHAIRLKYKPAEEPS
jgi:nitrogen fixation/metabolism regulation signal transduction histidine kinase